MKRFFENLARLVSYVPIIWNNYDWDYHGLLKLMEFKLGRMQRCLEDDPYGVHSKRYARQVAVCRELLRREMREEREKQTWAQMEARWGEHITWFEDIPGSDMSLWKSRWERATTPELAKECEEDFRRFMNHERATARTDMQYFCRMFEKHFRGWWT